MIKRGLALFALLFIIVVYGVYPLSLAAMGNDMESHLSPYADDYDDISLLKNDLENLRDYEIEGKTGDELYDLYSIVASPTILNGPDIDPEKTIYIAVGLERRYTNEETSALIEFLRKGGHAIFADDYGYLNEFASYYGVTYYRGKFFDNEFDRNENFTIVKAKLGVDKFTPLPIDPESYSASEDINETIPLVLNNLKDLKPLGNDDSGDPIILDWWDKDLFTPDGVWDSDLDGDGRVDEDSPEKGSPIDDDMDKAKAAIDGMDNNRNGKIDDEDPEEEGLNEDQLDDDGDWIDLNSNGRQEPMIWRDKDGNGKFGYDDINENGYFDVNDDFLFSVEGIKDPIQEYVSGDYGVDEEILDKKDNDNDGLIDEDLQGYRLLFNDATGMTSIGTRIIAHGGTHDPPSYVNLDDEPGANTPSLDEKGFATEVVDEISSPGSEIQLIIEVVICPECGGAIDIRTGECLDTTAEFRVKDVCKEDHATKDFLDFGSAIFISDSSLFLNDIYELDHLATDDDTGEIYTFKMVETPEGLAAQPIYQNFERYEEDWKNAPGKKEGPSEADFREAKILDETRRDFKMDQTPDGDLDYDNKKFARDLVRYLLPEGGIIVFDESRHFQENEFLIPIYASIHTITILTSDPWYSSAMIIIFILLFSFTIILVKNKEIWVHKHNINILHGRKSLPTTKTEQMERLRWAILNKVRMSRGLSPEEFQALKTADIDNLIKDPQLIDVVRNTNRVYSDDELRIIMDKTSKIGK